MKRLTLITILMSLVSSQAFAGAAAGTYKGANPESAEACSIVISADGTFTIANEKGSLLSQHLNLADGGPGVESYLISKGNMLVVNVLNADKSQVMVSSTDAMIACLATLQK